MCHFMVVTRVNLRFVYFLKKIYCHVAGHDCAMCQANIRCFQFSSSIEILIQFSPPIF